MLDVLKNFAIATLSAGINSSATSLSVTTGQGARFPAVPFNATIFNATDHANPSVAYWAGAAEIVRVTAIAGDTFTIVRAQEGTSAVTLNTGGKTYTIIAGVTAKICDDLGILATPMIDDFLGSSIANWLEVDASNGGFTATEGTPEWWQGQIGIRHLETGTSANGKVGLRGVFESGVGMGRLTNATRVMIHDLPTAGQDYIFAIGGNPNGAGSWLAFNSALWFSSASANWQFTVANNGAPYTTINTGVAVVAGAWLNLEAWANWTTDTAGARINGTATAGISGYADLSPNNRTRPQVYLQKIAGTTSRRVTLDKFGYLYDGI